MKIMHCPLNGPRNITEFIYGGPVTETPEVAADDDDAWANHIFGPHTPPGLVREWWCHLASGYWFIAERNTATDEIFRTYPATSPVAGCGETKGRDSE